MFNASDLIDRKLVIVLYLSPGWPSHEYYTMLINTILYSLILYYTMLMNNIRIPLDSRVRWAQVSALQSASDDMCL